MTTSLMRKDLQSLYKPAAQDAHPGLVLQRGLTEHREGDDESRRKLVERVCRSAPSEFYQHAYDRWCQATKDALRFRSVILKLETRLFIGLTGGGMLETGCVIGHSHGTPYIPGSGVKGVVNAHARERFGTAEDGVTICDELFGAPATEDRPAGLSGLITFHDAWWVPDSAKHPLVPEIVTTHHPDYYGKDGKRPASDFDSPVPNAQVAVQGAFLFVLEGPPAWLRLTEEMLIAALGDRGAGAKTRTGYGLFQKKAVVAAEPRCEWVDVAIDRLMTDHPAKKEDILRGKLLANAFAKLEDPALKSAAFFRHPCTLAGKGLVGNCAPGQIDASGQEDLRRVFGSGEQGSLKPTNRIPLTASASGIGGCPPTCTPLIESHRAEVLTLAARHRIADVRVFGSTAGCNA